MYAWYSHMVLSSKIKNSITLVWVRLSLYKRMYIFFLIQCFCYMYDYVCSIIYTLEQYCFLIIENIILRMKIINYITVL